MNEKEPFEITEETLASLRLKEDPVRIISEKLGVKQMGPADHIRTKHDIKAYVESGKLEDAQALLKHAQERRRVSQSIVIRASEQRGQNMTQ